MGNELSRGVVLVVDDDAEVRAAITALLSPRYEVLSAPDADSAHAMAVSRQPEAALMDVSLPGVDGPTALLRWRSDERTTSIPVLMVSGSRADEDTQVSCLSRGAVDFLQKPVSPRLLLARLDRAIRDGRERRRLQAAARTDALTGLANFRALDARLREEMDRARRYRYPLAMAMVDLDHLKRINDRYGHAAGNQLLADFAWRLTSGLRGTDFAARYGGDEFAVLLAHQSWREAAVLCDRLRASLIAHPLSTLRGGEGGLTTTISVGVAAHAVTSPKVSSEALL
ncbi:MAG TPA: diguanylate cyclase, partial [Myxococcales bacterium]|nr:diguanylate cyclase [Myxococcales bacterium]